MGRFGVQQIARRFHAGFVRSNESGDGFGAAADDRHFRDVELDAGQLDQLIDRCAGGKQRGKSVRLSFAIHVVRADDLAAAGHIFDDDRWVAGNMTRQMSHHQARDNVAAAAGRRSDDDAERFALVEGLRGESTGRNNEKNRYQKNRF